MKRWKQVEKKEIEQWYLKITDYAEELLESLDTLTDWPERVKHMQRNWIGKKIGANIDFDIDNKSLDGFVTINAESIRDLKKLQIDFLIEYLTLCFDEEIQIQFEFILKKIIESLKQKMKEDENFKTGIISILKEIQLLTDQTYRGIIIFFKEIFYDFIEIIKKSFEHLLDEIYKECLDKMTPGNKKDFLFYFYNKNSGIEIFYNIVKTWIEHLKNDYKFVKDLLNDKVESSISIEACIKNEH